MQEILEAEQQTKFALPTTKIDRNAIKAWMLSAAIYGIAWLVPSLFYAALAIGEGFESNLQWYQSIDWTLFSVLTAIELLIYAMNVFWYPRLRWKRWSYQVSEKEIDLLRGIIIRKRTLVPINRIQHVDTRQGVIYRKFDLSSVTISTAATIHEIPALNDAVADELRNKISTLVRKVKDDV